MTTKVIIADDHKLFRAGIIAILKDFPEVKVIDEAEDGEDLLKKLKLHNPDVILLDLNMPKMDGYVTLEKLVEKHKKLKVIVLSMYDTESHIAKSIEMGACGYLHKNADPDEIRMALESVRDVGLYFNDKTNKAMLHRMVQKKKLNPVFDNKNISLNDTERGVIKYVCEEMTSEAIGKKMFLSKRSIEGIRSELINKIGCKNVVGLALWAVKTGLVDL